MANDYNNNKTSYAIPAVCMHESGWKNLGRAMLSIKRGNLLSEKGPFVVHLYYTQAILLIYKYEFFTLGVPWKNQI